MLILQDYQQYYMLKEIIIAWQSYGKAHRFIKQHNLWKWIIVPGLLYTILFMVSMYFFGKTCNDFIAWLSLKTGLKAWLESINNGWLGFLFALGTLILWLMMMLLYFSLFKYIFLIVGSPIFSYLSEKTESILTGKNYPFSLQQLLKDIVRGIGLALRNGLWQTVYMFSFLLLSLLPLVGWAAPVIVVLIECYYYGFSMLDYSMERNKQNRQQSIAYIGNHKGLAIGNGFIFYIMHAVPIIGWILAPSYAVIAATLSIVEVSGKNNASL
jgi:CysZ protein